MNVSEKSALAFRHFVGLIHTPQVDPMFHDIVDHYLEKFPFNYTNYLGRTRKVSSTDVRSWCGSGTCKATLRFDVHVHVLYSR